MAVVLLLPDDETPLADRAAALGQWCQGFLGGFGLTAREGALSGEAVEVLQDLASIAQVQSALEDSEDGETDYMEVMEYLRVAPAAVQRVRQEARAGGSGAENLCIEPASRAHGRPL